VNFASCTAHTILKMQGKSFSQTLHRCIGQDLQATRHCVTCCIFIRLSHRMLTVKLHKGTAASTKKITAAHKQERDNMMITLMKRTHYHVQDCSASSMTLQYLHSTPGSQNVGVCINKHAYTLPLRNVYTCALSHVHTCTC